MEQVPNSAFKIAQLPAGATTLDIIKQINLNVDSMKGVRRHCAGIVKKIKNKNKKN
jgi:hypothetical protein